MFFLHSCSPLTRSLSSCDACGSLRGGSSAIEIEAGNDVLVAARACFSEVEQGVAANHVLYKDAAAAARAAAANREAPLTHSFAAKTLPRVVEVMLDQSSPSALYAQDIEETVLGALRFWGWALQHNLWDGLQCVTIILDWDQHFYTGGKVLVRWEWQVRVGLCFSDDFPYPVSFCSMNLIAFGGRRFSIVASGLLSVIFYTPCWLSCEECSWTPLRNNLLHPSSQKRPCCLPLPPSLHSPPALPLPLGYLQRLPKCIAPCSSPYYGP